MPHKLVLTYKKIKPRAYAFLYLNAKRMLRRHRVAVAATPRHANEAEDESMVDQGKGQKHQEVKMLNRKLLELTGVVNVESFDSEEFLLETELGYLAVKGQNLHMKHLSLEQGLVSIEGLVHSLAYMDGSNTSAKSKGLFGKLFK